MKLNNLLRTRPSSHVVGHLSTFAGFIIITWAIALLFHRNFFIILLTEIPFVFGVLLIWSLIKKQRSRSRSELTEEEWDEAPTSPHFEAALSHDTPTSLEKESEGADPDTQPMNSVTVESETEAELAHSSAAQFRAIDVPYRPLTKKMYIIGVALGWIVSVVVTLLVQALATALRSLMGDSAWIATVTTWTGRVSGVVFILIGCIWAHGSIKESRNRTPTENHRQIKISTDKKIVTLNDEALLKILHELVVTAPSVLDDLSNTDDRIYVATRKVLESPIFGLFSTLETKEYTDPLGRKQHYMKRNMTQFWLRVLALVVFVVVLVLTSALSDAGIIQLYAAGLLGILLVVDGVRLAMNLMWWSTRYFVVTDKRVYIIVQLPVCLFWLTGRVSDLPMGEIKRCGTLDQDNLYWKLIGGKDNNRNFGVADLDGITEDDDDFHLNDSLPYYKVITQLINSLRPRSASE